MKSKVKKTIILLLAPLFILILNFQCNSFIGNLNTSTVSARPQIQLYPGGQPIGVKLNTKGVLVVGISNIRGVDGKVYSPAGEAGIKPGDSILSMNGVEVNTCEAVQKIVDETKDKNIKITIKRKDSKSDKIIKGVKNSDNQYKIGLWVRDSTAGIGTLTFYDPNSKKFGALGHAITDMDTQDILSVKEGKIVPSIINSVKKGVKGEPGELRGTFIQNKKPFGDVYSNTNCGIFGKCSREIISNHNIKPISIAYRNEIKEGKAQILTTINGSEPKLYDIKIEGLVDQKEAGPKSMIIRITDKRLLKETGGIIQGMSGSPIIQNNKLIGAVTHVLVNKPQVGYGVYIEWMLKDAGITTK